MLEKPGTQDHINPAGSMDKQIRFTESNDELIHIDNENTHCDSIEGIKRSVRKYFINNHLRHQWSQNSKNLNYKHR